MNKIKVAINGFGRIGRSTAKLMLQNESIQIVAINDLTDNGTLCNLFKYDSVHGKFNGTVTSDDNSVTINGDKITVSSEKKHSIYLYKFGLLRGN